MLMARERLLSPLPSGSFFSINVNSHPSFVSWLLRSVSQGLVLSPLLFITTSQTAAAGRKGESPSNLLTKRYHSRHDTKPDQENNYMAQHLRLLPIKLKREKVIKIHNLPYCQAMIAEYINKMQLLYI